MAQETFQNTTLKLTTIEFASTDEQSHALDDNCMAFRLVMRDGNVYMDNGFAAGVATSDVELRSDEAMDYESPLDADGNVRTLYVKPAQASGKLEIWERVAIHA